MPHRARTRRSSPAKKLTGTGCCRGVTATPACRRATRSRTTSSPPTREQITSEAATVLGHPNDAAWLDREYAALHRRHSRKMSPRRDARNHHSTVSARNAHLSRGRLLANFSRCLSHRPLCARRSAGHRPDHAHGARGKAGPARPTLPGPDPPASGPANR